jgi:AcrR family transcriptional regulator
LNKSDKKQLNSRENGAEMAIETPRKVRDAGATKQRILNAAKKEFARNGLGGARVDEIAERAKANKRMIYHYFGNKEDLFQIVLEAAYADIRAAEQRLDLEHLPPRDALEKLVRFTWGYYLKNPEFITLVNSENLHKARHLKKSSVIGDLSKKLVGMVDSLLDRGAKEGVFRSGIDPVQLNITIAAIGYYYLTNRFTGSIIFRRDLTAQDALESRIAFNIETIMRLVCVDP